MKQVHAYALIAAFAAMVGVQDARAGDADGFLYGTITTESGNEYTGFIRWGTEESFWDDLFHSMKTDLREVRKQAEDARQRYGGTRDDAQDRRRDRDRRRGFDVFRWRLRWHDNTGGQRIFIARFGDITEITPTGDNDAELLLKSGARMEVSGYANDVGEEIKMDDAKLGEVELRWDRIKRIQFKPVPRGADPGVSRLYGRVETDAGTFEGWIQWDKQECRSDDILDGESDDGDMKIPFAHLVSIERRSRRAARVQLDDGRTLTLEGTNDVNDENRGIMVEDKRFGRVTVPWREFNKVTFTTGRDSGSGYNDFEHQGPLHGTVTDVDGEALRGRIIFDLDESANWEILNGSNRDIEYDIPFWNVATIEVLDRDSCRIVLRSGEEVELEDSQDVTDNNDGVLVFRNEGSEPTYLAWDEVQKIEFDH